MIEIDARGQACPKPVIMTKQKLDEINQGLVVTIVDNEVAKENVSKLAQGMGLSSIVEKKGNDYYISIEKGDREAGVETNIGYELEDITIGISSNTMGKGDERLGEILIKSFIYTLSETKPYPSTLVFYNGGVRLTTEGSEVLDDLKKLEDAGVEIISCGTCLDFLNIKDKLEVGSISNMYTIYEILRESEKNIII